MYKSLVSDLSHHWDCKREFNWFSRYLRWWSVLSVPVTWVMGDKGRWFPKPPPCHGEQWPESGPDSRPQPVPAACSHRLAAPREGQRWWYAWPVPKSRIRILVIKNIRLDIMKSSCLVFLIYIQWKLKMMCVTGWFSGLRKRRNPRVLPPATV